MREYVVDLLREEIIDVAEPEVATENSGVGTFNPLGIGIPLLLMGGVLIVIFPPVGLLLFGVAALLVVWGVVATLVTRQSPRKS